MQQINMRQSHESGFTLVELAIVMLIIGLLVGGVLKGQEMIESARVSSTISAMESYDASVNSFRDRYAQIPADIPNPATRIPNCDEAPCNGTPGDTGDRIAGTPGDGFDGVTGATRTMWSQLAAANFLKGANGTQAGGTDVIGQTVPEADIGGGFLMGHSDTTDGGPDNNLDQNQHYLYITSNITNGVDKATAPMTPGQASQIDRKLDDNQPQEGSIVANTDCTPDDTEYNTALTASQCSLYKEFIN